MEEELNFCYSRLLGRIIEKFKTRENFAQQIDMSIPTLIGKLNGKVDFRSKEIFKFCTELDIPLSQVEYFFYQTN